ncbi:hypothetical protein [Chryseobacterium gleum]|uniref:hypothetical protein n=1 Tax=Chryseobacterium gleum TaxID=250 RepID=UPI0028AF59E9|nr:hypothetical protein [Chryseobacterium gleum]
MNRLLDIIKGSEILVYKDEMFDSIILKYEGNISKTDYNRLVLTPILLKNLHINYSFLFRKIEHMISFLSANNKIKFIHQVQQRILYSNNYLEAINEANHFFFLKRTMLERNKVLYFDLNGLLSLSNENMERQDFKIDERIEKTEAYKLAELFAMGTINFLSDGIYYKDKRYSANSLAKIINVNKAYLSDTFSNNYRDNNKNIFSPGRNKTLKYLVDKLNIQNIKISDFFLDKYNVL